MSEEGRDQQQHYAEQTQAALGPPPPLQPIPTMPAFNNFRSPFGAPPFMGQPMMPHHYFGQPPPLIPMRGDPFIVQSATNKAVNDNKDNMSPTELSSTENMDGGGDHSDGNNNVDSNAIKNELDVILGNELDMDNIEQEIERQITKDNKTSNKMLVKNEPMDVGRVFTFNQDLSAISRNLMGGNSTSNSSVPPLDSQNGSSVSADGGSEVKDPSIQSSPPSVPSFMGPPPPTMGYPPYMPMPMHAPPPHYMPFPVPMTPAQFASPAAGTPNNNAAAASSQNQSNGNQCEPLRSPFQNSYVDPKKENKLMKADSVAFAHYCQARNTLFQQFISNSQNVRQMRLTLTQMHQYLQQMEIDAKIQERKYFNTYFSAAMNNALMNGTAASLMDHTQQNGVVTTTSAMLSYYSTSPNDTVDIDDSEAGSSDAKQNEHNSVLAMQSNTRMNVRRQPKKRTKKPKFSDYDVRVFADWYNMHLDNPYPSKQEKQMMAELTGLTRYQVSRWFCNARTRRPPPPPTPMMAAMNGHGGTPHHIPPGNGGGGAPPHQFHHGGMGFGPPPNMIHHHAPHHHHPHMMTAPPPPHMQNYQFAAPHTVGHAQAVAGDNHTSQNAYYTQEYQPNMEMEDHQTQQPSQQDADMIDTDQDVFM